MIRACSNNYQESNGAICRVLFWRFFLSFGIDVLMGLIPSVKATFRELDAFFNQVIEEHETKKSDDHQPNKLHFVDILL
jgi:hypothetical protein